MDNTRHCTLSMTVPEPSASVRDPVMMVVGRGSLAGMVK